jgi:hypothetical protein
MKEAEVHGLRALVLAVLVAFVSLPAKPQDTLFQESFEGTSGNYTIVGGFDAGPDDFFKRADDSMGLFAVGPLSGEDGSFYFAGEDIDHISPDSGIVTFSPVLVAGYQDLAITVALSAPGFSSSTISGSVYDNINTGSHFDYLRVEYRFTGSWISVGCFAGGVGSFSSDPDEPFELDLDCNGTGDGTVVPTDFQDFTFSIPSGGLSVEIRIVTRMTDEREEIAFDNIRVTGTPIPEPELSMSKTVVAGGGTCPGQESLTVLEGSTVKYCFAVTNTGSAPAYDVAISDDAGTPGIPGDDYGVPLSGLTNEDADGQADDLAQSATATGEATIVLNLPDTIINTAEATGKDSLSSTISHSDSATVTVLPLLIFTDGFEDGTTGAWGPLRRPNRQTSRDF